MSGSTMRSESGHTHLSGLLVYSLVAGPVIWFFHFLLVWGMAEMGCRINFLNVELISPENIIFFVTLATSIALLAVAWGGFAAYRSWRQLDAHTNEVIGEERLRFLITLALLLSGLFFVSIIFTATPTYFLDVCDLAV
jgi:hypothetical protein